MNQDRSIARGSIALLAAGLVPGSTVREVCPMCGGGQHRERSLAVTKTHDHRTVYICHRSSCGFKGKSGPEQISVSISTPAFTPRPYPYATRLPQSGDEVWERLITWGIDPQLCYPYVQSRADKSTLGTEDFYICRDFAGLRLGGLSRLRRPDGTKMVRTWKEVPGAWMSCYGFSDGWTDSRPIWVVEDCLSALRLGLTGHRAVALLGTHMTGELSRALEYEARVSAARVLIALDPDASQKAVTTSIKLREMYGLDSRVVLLTEDLKDATVEQYHTLCEPYNV